MSWKYLKSTTVTMSLLIVSLFSASTAIAEIRHWRDSPEGYTEPYDGFLHMIILFSPKNDFQYLSDLNEESIVGIDSYGDYSSEVWRDMLTYKTEGGESRSDPWTDSLFFDADAQEMIYHLGYKKNFDAFFMVRHTVFQDFFDLMDNGWRLGTLYDEEIEQISGDTLGRGDEPVYLPSFLNFGKGYGDTRGLKVDLNSDHAAAWLRVKRKRHK